MESFLAEVKIFSFWLKTMDYSQAFWPKSSSFFVVLLLLAGRCYEAEICAIMLPLRSALAWNHFWQKSKFSVFGQKTMDYSQAFWPKSSSFFVVLLILAGRCYEAEICASMLPLRSDLAWNHFWPKSKCSVFAKKPWTIVRRFGQNRAHSLWFFYSSLEGATELKFAPLCSP